MTITRVDFKGMTDEQVCKLALYRLQNLNVKFESFSTECELFGGIENEEDPSKSIPPNPYKDDTAIDVAVLIYNGLAVEPVDWDDIAQLKTALVIKTAKPKESITTPPSFNSDEDIKTATSEMGGISSHTDIDSEGNLQKKLAVIAKYETLLVKSEKEIMESTLNRMLIVAKAITKIGSSEHPELADYKEKFIQLQGYYQEILDSYNKVGKKAGIGWDPGLTKGLSSDTVLGYIQSNTKFSSGMANWGAKYVSDLVYKGNDVFPGVLKSDNPDKTSLDKAYSEVVRMRNLFGPINSDLLKDFMTQMYDAKIQGYGTVLSDNLVSYTGVSIDSTEEDFNQYSINQTEVSLYDSLTMADLGLDLLNQSIGYIKQLNDFQSSKLGKGRLNIWNIYSEFTYNLSKSYIDIFFRCIPNKTYRMAEVSNERIYFNMLGSDLYIHYANALSNSILDSRHFSIKWTDIPFVLPNLTETLGISPSIVEELRVYINEHYIAGQFSSFDSRTLMQIVNDFLVNQKNINNPLAILASYTGQQGGTLVFLKEVVGKTVNNEGNEISFKDWKLRLEIYADNQVKNGDIKFLKYEYFSNFYYIPPFITRELSQHLNTVHSESVSMTTRLIATRTIMAIEFIQNKFPKDDSVFTYESYSWTEALILKLGTFFNLPDFTSSGEETVDIVTDLVRALSIKEGRNMDQILPIKESESEFLSSNASNVYLSFKYKKFPTLVDLLFINESSLNVFTKELKVYDDYEVNIYNRNDSRPRVTALHVLDYVYKLFVNTKRFFIMDKTFSVYNQQFKDSVLQNINLKELVTYSAEKVELGVGMWSNFHFQWINDFNKEVVSSDYINFIAAMLSLYPVLVQGVTTLPSKVAIEEEFNYWNNPSDQIKSLYLNTSDEIIKKIKTDINVYYTNKKITSIYYKSVSDQVDAVLIARKRSIPELTAYTTYLAKILMQIGYQYKIDAFGDISNQEAKSYYDVVVKKILDTLRPLINKNTRAVSENFSELYVANPYYKKALALSLEKLLSGSGVNVNVAILDIKKCIQNDRFLSLYQFESSQGVGEFTQWINSATLKVRRSDPSYGLTMKLFFDKFPNNEPLVNSFIKEKSIEKGGTLNPSLGSEYLVKLNEWVNSSDMDSTVKLEGLKLIEQQLVSLGESFIKEKYLDTEAIPCLLKNSIIGG